MKRTKPLLIAAMLLMAGAIGFLIRRGPPIRRFAVAGDSMLPSFAPGEHVLVSAWSRHHAIGDVIVLADPEQQERWLVKRVASPPDQEGRIWVLGDNEAASRDSRNFGRVSSNAVAGRVMFAYKGGHSTRARPRHLGDQ
jgi:nickel-type superoxide dismutase maturation protease